MWKCSMRFQPGEDPSLLHDFEIFANLSLTFVSSSSLQADRGQISNIRTSDKTELSSGAMPANHIKQRRSSAFLAKAAHFRQVLISRRHTSQCCQVQNKREKNIPAFAVSEALALLWTIKGQHWNVGLSKYRSHSGNIITGDCSVAGTQDNMNLPLLYIACWKKL